MNDQRALIAKGEFLNKLKILDEFKKCINENLAKIDTMKYHNDKIRKYIENFKKEDLFVNADKNYKKVYEAITE